MLEKYDVYEWVDEVPVGAKVIDTKWVQRKKEKKMQMIPNALKQGLRHKVLPSDLGLISVTPMRQCVEKGAGEF